MACSVAGMAIAARVCTVRRAATGRAPAFCERSLSAGRAGSTDTLFIIIIAAIWAVVVTARGGGWETTADPRETVFTSMRVRTPRKNAARTETAEEAHSGLWDREAGGGRTRPLDTARTGRVDHWEEADSMI
jgi:hypothetical protein